MSLASRDCVPCRGGVPPLKGDAITPLQSQLDGWEVINEHHLKKDFKFKDFKDTQDFRGSRLRFGGGAVAPSRYLFRMGPRRNYYLDT